MPTSREETLALLRRSGMTTVFGNPGSTELPFLRDWPEDFRYVLGLQEAAVIGMADGFAQAIRAPVLVNLHAAVGVGNALGNLFTAFRNRTPLVVLAGQQPRPLLAGRPYLAGEAPREFPQPYVKWTAEPARGEDTAEIVAQAIRIAVQPPQGPVFVSVPADDWNAVATPVATRVIVSDFVASPAALKALAAALAHAARPALVVGAGIDREDAWDEMLALAERLNAAIWTSPVSSRCGFPEDHPLFMGFLAPLKRQIAEALAGCDVVAVIGAPLFTYHIESAGDLEAGGARFFQLTDDPEEAASAGVGTTLLTTLKPALGALLSHLKQTTRPAPQGHNRPPIPAPADPLPAAYVLHELALRLPRDAIIVTEAPSHHGLLHRHIPIRSSGSFYSMASGGMGYGLPAAVGIALADPSRRVVAVMGDGASHYCIQALWNAAQLQLPISFIVLNNGGYGALKMLGNSRYDGPPPGVDLPGIDLVSIATGYGCPAGRVTRAADLADGLEAALFATGPFLLDIAVAPPEGLLY